MLQVRVKPRQNIVFTIDVIYEQAAHEADCQGKECQYNTEIETIVEEMDYSSIKYAILPNTFSKRILQECFYSSSEFQNFWIEKFIECDEGRYSCSKSKECVDHNLAQHEYRYTITKISVDIHQTSIARPFQTKGAPTIEYSDMVLIV